MGHTHSAKYSWYNKTEGKAYYWEDKELLNYQRNHGHECVNVESDILISKKQMLKGPSITLKKRINYGITIQNRLPVINKSKSIQANVSSLYNKDYS